jgi:Ca-activated chloride channel family protein
MFNATGMHYLIAILLATAGITVSLNGQDAHKLLRDGDRYYQKGGYPEAEEYYRKSLARSNSANGHFNLGNSVYYQGRFPEAVGQFEQAARQASSSAKRAEAYYNLGNAHFEAGNLEKSIEAYKNALRNDPSDVSAKYNLTLAQKKLRQQTPPPPPPQQSPGNESSSQQKPPPPNQQPGQQPGNEPQSSKTPSPGQPGEGGQKLSREEAEALLRIAGQEEKKVQSKMRKDPGQAIKSKKDW